MCVCECACVCVHKDVLVNVWGYMYIFFKLDSPEVALKIFTLALPHVVTGTEPGWSQMTSFVRC